MRPRFSSELETLEFKLPEGKKLGGFIAAAYSPEGDLLVLHQWNPPGVDVSHLNGDDYLPDVARFDADLNLIDAWGGPDHVPAIDGVPQWPAGREGIECDAEGNIWIFGYSAGDDNVLKFSPKGELLRQFGQRGKRGNDDDTTLLGGPTSCYHDVENREVFFSDGYGNHRVIAFNSDTGEFTRMWGAYGRKPSELSEEEGYGNPVHKVEVGPNGNLYVCDRLKNRVQEFRRVPGGVEYVREVHIAPGTGYWGSAFDLAFPEGGKFMYVSDGSNIRIWIVDLDSFEVIGWATAYDEVEGDDNIPRHFKLVHRFRMAPNGDLLLCCTGNGLKRMKYLGVY
jgi:DNA-binding beta-propeller fold protein YncE